MTIYQTVLSGHYLTSGDKALNVFHLESTGSQGIADVPSILKNIGHGLWRVLANSGLLYFTSQLFKYDQMSVTELSGGSNAGVQSVFIIGSEDGIGEDNTDPLPNANAYSIRFVRPSNQFRHGYKRFGGVTEGMQTNGKLTSGALAALQSVGNGLLAGFNPYTDANAPILAQSLNYVLQRKTVSGTVLTTPVYARPVGSVADEYVSSQNTRKVGRGS